MTDNTTATQYPNWQTGIRKAQAEARAAAEEAARKQREKEAQQLLERTRMFIEKLAEVGIQVHAPLDKPVWVSPDGHRFEFAGRFVNYPMTISKRVPGASDDVLDTYADWIDAGWLDSYCTHVSTRLTWNEINSVDIANALDNIEAKLQNAPAKNARVIAKLEAHILEAHISEEAANERGNADSLADEDAADVAAVERVAENPILLMSAIHEFMKRLASETARTAVNDHVAEEDEIYDRV